MPAPMMMTFFEGMSGVFLVWVFSDGGMPLSWGGVSILSLEETLGADRRVCGYDCTEYWKERKMSQILNLNSGQDTIVG